MEIRDERLQVWMDTQTYKALMQDAGRNGKTLSTYVYEKLRRSVERRKRKEVAA